MFGRIKLLMSAWNQGPVSISEKTFFRKISLSLEAARFVIRIVRSLWNLTDTSAAVLPMCLSNFKAIRQFKIPISWLRDFTRPYEKTSFRILRRCPGVHYITRSNDGLACWHTNATHLRFYQPLRRIINVAPCTYYWDKAVNYVVTQIDISIIMIKYKQLPTPFCISNVFWIPFLSLMTSVWCFRPWYFISLERRVGVATSGNIHIRFKFLSKDDMQECFGLCIWLALHCLLPWTKHLSH